MYFLCTGFSDDALHIARCDAATGHDDDTPGGLLDDLLQKGDASFCRGGLSGSEHTLKATGDNLFQSFMRSGCEVKRTMEGQ